MFAVLVALLVALPDLAAASDMNETTATSQFLEKSSTAAAVESASSDDEVSAMGAGHCTHHDNDIIDQKGPGNADGTMPKIAAQCGKDSWSFWSGFNVAAATSCVQRNTGMSSSCAKCYGQVGQYAHDNCKSKCLWTWCSRGCLDCVKPYEATVTACLGRKSPDATYCR